MNEAFAMVLEQDQRVSGLRDLLTFVGVPSKAAVKDISGSASEILKNIKGIIDGLLLQAIEKRSKAEFEATRDEVFPKYFVAIMSLSGIVQVVVPPAVVQRISWEAFSEIEADLRDKGLAKFGQMARDQAVFTTWTLRKINALLPRVSAAPLEEHKALDRKLVKEFSLYSAWAQFHLDCLLASIRFDKAISPEILDDVCDGLRALVNAYGLIREAVGIREPHAEGQLPPYEADDEDNELIRSSMDEIEADL